MTVNANTGEATAKVMTYDPVYRSAVAAGSLAGITVTGVAADRLLGRAAGDVTGDRRADLVQLVQRDDGVALEVIRGSAAGFLPAVTWWSDKADVTTLGLGDYQLVVTDFTGDGKARRGDRADPPGRRADLVAVPGDLHRGPPSPRSSGRGPRRSTCPPRKSWPAT